MLAPLWSNTDVPEWSSESGNNVYYHIYDRTDASQKSPNDRAVLDYVLNKAQEEALEYGGVSHVDPSWVMIVTWVNMMPRVKPYHDQVRQHLSGYMLLLLMLLFSVTLTHS